MVILDGIKFYETSQGYLMGNYKGKPIRMHIYVWQKHNGEIPDGFHVHHKDGDKTNNDISNLELLPKFEHLSTHSKAVPVDKARENMINNVLPKAVEWHKSDKSTEFHKELYERVTREKWLQKVTKTCIFCGKEYETVHSKKDVSKFCSNVCKTAYRKSTGVDDIESNCSFCGKPFTKNKYSSKQFCSKECRELALKAKKANKQ